MQPQKITLNNMTASFNKEELKILEMQYNAIQRQSHDTESVATPMRPQTLDRKSNLADSQLDTKRLLRADLDESAVLIEPTEDDIARKSQPHLNDEIKNSGMLSSVLLQKESAYSYSMTDNNTPIRSLDQVAVKDLTHQNEKLVAEVADFQAILKTQHGLLEEERIKREKAEEALSMSQLKSSELNVVDQIEKALMEKGEDKLKELMQISLMNERQNQQRKDG